MTAAAQLQRMTVNEFINWRGDGTGRIYELVNGEVRAQDPASDAHGTIESNLNYLVASHLRAARPRCRVVANPGIQPRLRAHWNYRIPELGVTCAPNRPDAHMMPDPILLVEVLSPTNEADTWSNIPLYASVPTVLEILIVDSTKVAAELLRRGEDGSWPQAPEAIGPGGIIRLASIGLEIAIEHVYQGTYLAEQSHKPASK